LTILFEAPKMLPKTMEADSVSMTLISGSKLVNAEKTLNNNRLTVLSSEAWAEPLIFNQCTMGVIIPKVVIKFLRAPDTAPYTTLILEDATVDSFSSTGRGPSEGSSFTFDMTSKFIKEIMA